MVNIITKIAFYSIIKRVRQRYVLTLQISISYMQLSLELPNLPSCVCIEYWNY